MFLEWFSSLYIVFSCILNKVNLPGINAYCYAIETISCLYSALWFMHNSFIIFVLDSYKQDIGLAQQVRKSRPVTSNR